MAAVAIPILADRTWCVLIAAAAAGDFCTSKNGKREVLTKGRRCVDGQLMAFVSVTRLRIRFLRFMPPFVLRTMQTLRQVRHASGFRGGALLGDRGRTFWTMTVWREELDMRRYMVRGAHLAAMPKLLDWCDEASVVH